MRLIRTAIVLLLSVWGLNCSDDGKSSGPTGPDSEEDNTPPPLSLEERRVQEAQQLIDSLGWSTPRPIDSNPAALEVPGDLVLQIAYGDSVFYRLTDETYGTWRTYMIRPFLGNAFLTENRFFRLADQTKGLRFVSRDPNVACVDENGGVTFDDEGETSIAVGIDSIYIDIPIRVQMIDLRRYASTSSVIEEWGLADATRSVVLDWLDSVTLNEKDYYNEEPGEDLYVEQWFYSSLPRGYLEFRGSRSNSKSLFRVRTQHWENIIFSPIYPQFYINQ